MPWPSAMREFLSCALRPWEGFPRRMASVPSLGRALGGLLALRTPFAFVGLALALRQYCGIREGLLAGALPFQGVAVEPGLLRELGVALPAGPVGLPALAWAAALAPLSVLSLWLHHVVWDHAALWVLGCRGRSIKVTARAEADAMGVGTVGAAVALLGDVPGLGQVLAPLLLSVGVWFWFQRGFALAAWHDLPVWKGLVATFLHAVGAVGLFLLMLVLSWLLAMQMAGV